MRFFLALLFALISTATSAEIRVLSETIIGCPSGEVLVRVVSLWREHENATGKAKEDTKRAATEYTVANKCQFFEKGEEVVIEWSSQEQVPIGNRSVTAVCLHRPITSTCSFVSGPDIENLLEPPGTKPPQPKPAPVDRSSPRRRGGSRSNKLEISP